MKNNSYPMRHITRQNFARVPLGWLVRLYSSYPDYYVYDYFYDEHYGGPQTALEEAMAYRDWLEQTWPKPPGYAWNGRPHGYLESRRADNKSGKTGVHYAEYETTKTDRLKGRVYRYKITVREWRASWVEDGVNRLKRYSVAKYGDAVAKEKAIAWRKKMELTMRNG